MERNNSEYQSKVTTTGVNILYFLIMVLFITIGAYAQSRDFYSGILITEFVLIVIPVFLYVIFKKGSLKRELRFNKLHLLDGLLVILIFSFAYPIAVFLNTIGNVFLSLFGELIPSPIPIADDINDYFVLILIVAGSAGICEEVLFRGLIMRGYEKLGRWKSIIFTAVLFSMLHINIQNIIGPLFLGILLGYVVYTTDSIFAGMLGHFVNNAISVSISYLIMQLPFSPDAIPQEVPRGMMLQSLIMAALFFSFIAAVTGPVLYFCLKALKEINMERRSFNEDNMQADEKQSLGDILKNFKSSWPLYLSLCIFIFFSIAQFTYIATGKSLFDIFF